MATQQDRVIRYKWDAWTGSGYRLRFDAADRQHHYCVEDWDNHVVCDDWHCATLDEALGVLNRFFTVDFETERGLVDRAFTTAA